MKTKLVALLGLLTVLSFAMAMNAEAALVFRGQFGGKNLDIDGFSGSVSSGLGLDMDQGERFMWGAAIRKHNAEVTSKSWDPYWGGQCQGPWCGNYPGVRQKYDASTVTLEVNGKHYFKREKISYYALGFVAMNHLKLKNRQEKIKENFVSAGAGVGVDFEVAPSVALNLEGRYEAGLGSDTENFGAFEVASMLSKAKSTSVLAGVVLSF